MSITIWLAVGIVLPPATLALRTSIFRQLKHSGTNVVVAMMSAQTQRAEGIEARGDLRYWCHEHATRAMANGGHNTAERNTAAEGSASGAWPFLCQVERDETCAIYKRNVFLRHTARHTDSNLALQCNTGMCLQSAKMTSSTYCTILHCRTGT